jgi:uncharacterized protein
MSEFYLHEGLPQPAPTPLDAPYWSGLQENRLVLQHCESCQQWQWGPEWICHHCHSEDVVFTQVAPAGKIYSYERVWHPVHPALKEQGPYIVVLVEIPEAGNVRLIGNLLGDPEQAVTIGAPVQGVFEHHEQAGYTLLQWQVA